MAAIVTERLQTREIRFTDSGEQATREFYVHDNATTPLITEPYLAVNVPGIPTPGSSFPTKPKLVVVGVESNIVEGDRNLFRVTCLYQDKTFGLGEVVYERSVGGNVVDWWRMSPNVPNDPLSNSNTIDIGGVKADIAGTPTSFLRVTSELRITEKMIRNEFDLVAYKAYVGRRNSVSFKGIAPGLLLYMGAQSTGAFGDSLELVQHRFVYDEWLHCQQVPRRNTSGNIVLDATGNAVSVYWRQPFPNTIDFNSLSTNF